MLKASKFQFALISFVILLLLLVGIGYFEGIMKSSGKSLGLSTVITPTPSMKKCERDGDIAYIGEGLTCKEYWDDFDNRYLTQEAAKPTIPQYFAVKAPTEDPDPPILCPIYEKCGGGSIPLKRSECQRATCCLFADKPVFVRDKSLCVVQGSATSKSSEPFDCAIGDQKVKMTSMDECFKAMNAYWEAKNQTIPTYTYQPVVNPTQTQSQPKTIDTSACYQEYQYETQSANSLSGSTRDAAIAIASQSLNRCLTSGIVEVNRIVRDPTPTKVDSGYYGGKYP